MTRALGWTATIALVLGLVLGFGYAPTEVTQGNVQRIMYLHVPSILTAYLAFGIVFVGSLAYLFTQNRRWDDLAAASAESGVLFTGLTLVSGAIWGKPTWGTWWTWDARLTATAILFVIYLGYLLLRGMVDDPERGARYAAVLGIVGALNIPIVHFSVLWWRTLHQPPSLFRPGAATMPAAVWSVVLANAVAFALLYAYFAAKRISLLKQEQELGA